MKNYIIYLISMLSLAVVHSQKIEHIYPFVGLHVSSSATVNNTDALPDKGLFYGIGLRLGFKNRMGLNVEPHVNQFEFNVQNETVNAFNITVPLNLSYKFTNYNFDNLESILKFNELMVGAYASQFLSIKTPNEDFINTFKKYDYGFTAGLTLRFLVFHFGVKYYHSLSKNATKNLTYQSNYAAVSVMFPF